MKPIDEFVLGKMAAYSGGGLDYETAVHFTLGELRAIYRGNHWTAAGKVTQPPAPIGEAAAMERAERDLEELRGSYCAAMERPLLPGMTAHI
jgi:hypothetical protein